MSDHGANPIFFNNKINIGRPEHSLTPSDNISFFSYVHHPYKKIWKRPCCQRSWHRYFRPKTDSKSFLSDLCHTFLHLSPILEVIGKFLDWRSDCHKLIPSFFRVYFKRIPAKIIKYHDYIKFSTNPYIQIP